MTETTGLEIAATSDSRNEKNLTHSSAITTTEYNVPEVVWSFCSWQAAGITALGSLSD